MCCAHSPTFPSLHLCHNSFSNPSVALPTSQLIPQPFRCFTYVNLILKPFFRFSYVTGSSLTSPGEPPMIASTSCLLLLLFFSSYSSLLSSSSPPLSSFSPPVFALWTPEDNYRSEVVAAMRGLKEVRVKISSVLSYFRTSWMLVFHYGDTHQGYLSGCGRILYVDVIFTLRLVAVNLSNCCKMQNGTLIVSMY